MTITIAYINFWKDPNNDSYFTRLLQHYFKDVKVVPHTSNPDILISSVMGPIQNVIQTSAKLKLLFVGENTERYPQYNHTALVDRVFHLKVGFYPNKIEKEYIHFPLWLMYYPYYQGSKVLDYIQSSYNQNSTKKKSHLGSLIARHDRDGQRTVLYQALTKRGSVLCPSKFKHNCPPIGPNVSDKIDFLSKTVFNICPENSANTQYWTEKIFQAFQGGTIPIYWAISPPLPDVIQRNAYVFCNDITNLEAVATTVDHAVTHKDDMVISNRNGLFTTQSKHVVSDMYQTLIHQIQYRLTPSTQRIYGISYASRMFQQRASSITQQANRSNYFDSFYCFNESIVDPSFQTKFSTVWNDSTRGGGWWIWKPYILHKLLQKISMNDVIVYVDAGCTINPHAEPRFREYIHMVNSHWTGMLRFQLSHKEKDFTNPMCRAYFKSKFNLSDSDLTTMTDQTQLVSTIHIIRKTSFTMDFFDTCMNILEDDPNLFTESYGTPHRHDQSVMSMLYKCMKGSLMIQDESYFGPNGGFGNETSKQCPFWATRKQT